MARSTKRVKERLGGQMQIHLEFGQIENSFRPKKWLSYKTNIYCATFFSFELGADSFVVWVKCK